MNKRYEKYLDINANICKYKNGLGKLLRVEVFIFEKSDNRNMATHGGHYYETFIHNMILASLFCGDPHTWKINNRIHELNKNILEATANHVNVYLHQEKQCDTTKRSMKLTFENGSIHMNMDSGEMRLYMNEDLLNEFDYIKIKSYYMNQKYSIQQDLVQRVANGECFAEDIDGLFLQENVLKWLIENEIKQ